jgi:hypothetical protein
LAAPVGATDDGRSEMTVTCKCDHFLQIVEADE